MANTISSRATLAALALSLAPFPLIAQQSQGGTTTQAKTPPLDFSGWLFGSFQYRTDSTAKSQNGGRAANQFGIDRAYLTFRMPAGDRAAIRITTDIFQNTTNGYYSGWSVRLKYGYLQYDVARDIGGHKGFALTGRIGMLHTVLVDYEESFWPRFYAQVATERNGFFSSADVGAAALLQLPGGYGELYGTITNGAGYASSENDRFKDVALRLSINPLASSSSAYLRSFSLSPWVYKGFTASKFQNDPSTLPAGWQGNVSGGLAKDRYGLFAGFRDRRLVLGGDIARHTEDVESGSNTAADPRTVSPRRGTLLDAFAIARPLEWFDATRKSSIGVVARVDHFRPYSNAPAASNPDAADRFVLGGVFWEPTPRTTLALDYQAQTRTSGSRTPEQRTLYLHWNATF
jgi:hypothetical protein